MLPYIVTLNYVESWLTVFFQVPNSPPSVYDLYFTFWIGMYSNTYLAVAPLGVFLLTVDRCLSLKFPLGYDRKMQNFLTKMGVVLMCGIYLASTGFFLLELPLNLNAVRDCPNFACLTVRFRTLPQLAFKIFIGTTNLICSQIFFYMLRATGNYKLINNRIVRFTAISEIALNIIPGYVAFFFNIVTGVPSSDYLGPWAVLSATIDASACSLFYSLVMLKKRWRIRRLKISQKSSTP
ncbi:hypothetical protein Ddc_03766 [Ditylenchus destructor]|nr:hypothetical protein Ddc_03766 [Ditylenchus destructor]